MWGLGVLTTPPAVKTFDTPKTSVIPQFPQGNWFREPLWIPKSMHAQVPYIKRCKSMHKVSLTYPWIPSHRSQRLFSIRIWLNLRMQNPGIMKADCWKTSACKWTCAVQRSDVQRRLYIVLKYSYLFPILFMFISYLNNFLMLVGIDPKLVNKELYF